MIFFSVPFSEFVAAYLTKSTILRGQHHFPTLLKYTSGDYKLDKEFCDQVFQKLEHHKKMVRRYRCFKQTCPEGRFVGGLSSIETEENLTSKLVFEIFEMLRNQYAPESIILDSKMENIFFPHLKSLT